MKRIFAKAEGAAGQLEHVSVARDQRFPRQLARAIGGDRDQRTVILLGLARDARETRAAARRA